jgi:succinate-acetate transporter protein
VWLILRQLGASTGGETGISTGKEAITASFADVLTDPKSFDSLPVGTE